MVLESFHRSEWQPVWQVRLQGVKRLAELRKREQELESLSVRDDALLAYDSLGAVSRAENVGLWMGNAFCYALLHQGTFCAGLLLEVSSAHSLTDARDCVQYGAYSVYATGDLEAAPQTEDPVSKNARGVCAAIAVDYLCKVDAGLVILVPAFTGVSDKHRRRWHDCIAWMLRFSKRILCGKQAQRQKAPQHTRRRHCCSWCGCSVTDEPRKGGKAGL